MKPEHMLLIAVGLGAFFLIGKPALDKAKAEEAKRALDVREKQANVEKKESFNTAMTGFGTFMTSGGQLATAGAGLMTKISDLIG